MQSIGLCQPHMPVDPRSLVEPSIAKASVHARNNVVLRAIAQKVRQVEAKRRVTVVIPSDKAAVHKNNHVAKRSIELGNNSLAQVASRNLELTPIPAHAGLGIAPPQWLESVRLLRSVAIG